VKILTLNYEYPPLGGGASPVAQAVCRELAAQGDRVDVVTMAFHGLPELEEEPNLRVLRVPCLRKERHICHGHELLSWMVTAYGRARRLLRGGRYDLIHCHFFLPCGVVARRLAAESGLPYVVTAHGTDVPGYNPDRFRAMHAVLRPFWRKIVRDASAITSPSRWLAGLIERSYGAPVGVTIIPNGIDESWIRPGPGRKSILFVSRLLRRKGAQFLLPAVAGLSEEWEVHVVGEGPFRGQLEEIARRLPRPVTFHGWVENGSAELAALYRDASIFVFPSLAENFPVSLLEAMAAGCAIVASDLESCREVLGDAARFFAPGDVDALRRDLEELTEDEAARRQLGEAAMRRAREHFGWREIGRRYRELLAGVAAGAAAGAPAGAGVR
jgi:glycosyltransferase involved in cell wall biosynthesis